MATHQTSHHWRAPLPVPRRRGSFFGAEVLEEMRSPLGSALWSVLRVVEAWGAAEPAVRYRLFEPGTRRVLDERLVVVEPAEPLRDVRILHGLTDGTTEMEDAALAARGIARWARRLGLERTESAFLEAATMIMPAAPVYALDFGRVLLGEGDSLAAEAWFQRTIALSRQQHDWDTYCRGQLWIAQTLLARGSYRASERSMLRSMRAGVRHGLRLRQAEAEHGLFMIAIERGLLQQAMEYALQAAATYGRGHRQIPRLANDVAVIWMERGEFAAALPVLRLAAPLIRTRQLTAYGSIARAAGALGERSEFEAAAAVVARLQPDFPLASTGYLDVARGAAALGEHASAHQWAELALSTAERRGESKQIFEIEAFLASLASDRAAEAARGLPQELAPITGALREELDTSLRAVEL
jgi:tetratricopeptide (TPR) repeat protein